MSVVVLMATVIVTLLIALAVGYKEKLKDGHNTAVRKAIFAIAVLSVIGVLLHGVNQFMANRQAGHMRKAQLQHTVLQNLLGFQNELAHNYMTLIKHSATIYNYSEYERVRSSLNGAGHTIPAWETKVNETFRSELRESQAAFDRLQKISLEVLIQAAAYPTLVPLPLSQWATKTLSAKFSDLPQLINAYHETPEVLEYATLVGRAVGAVIGGAYATAETLSQ
jgi:hypothetical protein